MVANVERRADSRKLRLNPRKFVEVIFSVPKQYENVTLAHQHLSSLCGLSRVVNENTWRYTVTNHLSVSEHTRDVIRKCAVCRRSSTRLLRYFVNVTNDSLFSHVLCYDKHVLSKLLPARIHCDYNLRPRRHNRSLSLSLSLC